MLSTLLGKTFPDRSFEAVNCGGICYASYRLVGLVEECLAYSPDFIVVASGHNEFLEPRYYKTLLAERKGQLTFLRLCKTAQLIQHIAVLARERADLSEAPTPSVLAPNTIDERYIVRDEEEYEQTRLHFAHNLEKIAHMCRKANVPVVLLTLPSNLRDWPPFHTVPARGVPEELLSSQLASISALLDKGDYRNALMLADDVLKLHPTSAAFYFLLAKCHDGLGNHREALALYRQARDLDGFPHRAPSAFNAAVRKVASESDAVLFDADKLFTGKSPDGIPGNDLFLDQCHPNEQGHRLLAQGLLETVSTAGLLERSHQ